MTKNNYNPGDKVRIITKIFGDNLEDRYQWWQDNNGKVTEGKIIKKDGDNTYRVKIGSGQIVDVPDRRYNSYSIEFAMDLKGIIRKVRNGKK